MDSTSFITFVLAALVVLVIPGPGVLYVVTRSLTQGLDAGLMSVLGLSAGALVHVVAATIGLSAILVASASAFGVIKLLGALYLIYLGLHAILTRKSPLNISEPRAASMYRVFFDGIVISVLNPKIALFFLAFLPQFVSPNFGPITQQFLFLGLLYVALAICTDGLYAICASSLRSFVNQRFVLGPVPRLTRGFVYLGLGASLALTEQKAP